MGGSVSVNVPQLDKRGQRAVKLAALTERDLGLFFQVFKKIDKDLFGKIFVDDFFEYLGEPRSIFSDAVFELNETPLSKGMLSFGDFVQTLCTYCLFEKEEIQRFIYFIFDKDKNGYIRTEDLEIYVKLINGVDFDEAFHSNLATGWDKLQKEFNKDGKVDFREFMVFNAEWPAMFFPAYRLQEKMIERSLGRKWWLKKKRAMQNIKDQAKETEEKKKKAEYDKQEAVRQRKIRKKMGNWAYYLCPCLRERWDKLFPPPEVKKELTEKEKRDLARKAKQDELKAEAIRAKNAPTLEYENFKKRKAQIQEGWAQQVIKPKRVFRERRVRAEDRHARWKGKFDM